MFYQSAYWDPTSFGKTADKYAITATCELGGHRRLHELGLQAVGEDQLPGRGSEQGRLARHLCERQDGQLLRRWGCLDQVRHQITINDPLSPAVMFEDVKFQEASWSTKGAVCVNDINRRIPGLAWQTSSCYVSMPDCSMFEPGKYLNTGIPVPNP